MICPKQQIIKYTILIFGVLSKGHHQMSFAFSLQIRMDFWLMIAHLPIFIFFDTIRHLQLKHNIWQNTTIWQKKKPKKLVPIDLLIASVNWQKRAISGERFKLTTHRFQISTQLHIHPKLVSGQKVSKDIQIQPPIAVIHSQTPTGGRESHNPSC